MIMRAFLIISFLSLVFYECTNAQVNVDHNEFWSKDVVLYHIGEINIRKLGRLKSVSETRLTHCLKDTTLNIAFYHFSYPHVSYIKISDTLLIHFIAFQKSNISLNYKDFTLNKNSSIEDFLAYFQLNESAVDSTEERQTILSHSSKKQIYHICLLSNKSIPFNTIDFFFSKKKKLLAILVPINCK